MNTRRPSPKPENWDALCAAYASGDPHRIIVEEAAYSSQLIAAGFPPLHRTLDVPDRTAPARGPDQ